MEQMTNRDIELLKTCIGYSCNSLEKQYKEAKRQIQDAKTYKESEKLFKQLREIQEQFDELSFLYQRLN